MGFRGINLAENEVVFFTTEGTEVCTEVNRGMLAVGSRQKAVGRRQKAEGKLAAFVNSWWFCD